MPWLLGSRVRSCRPRIRQHIVDGCKLGDTRESSSKYGVRKCRDVGVQDPNRSPKESRHRGLNYGTRLLLHLPKALRGFVRSPFPIPVLIENDFDLGRCALRIYFERTWGLISVHIESSCALQMLAIVRIHGLRFFKQLGLKGLYWNCVRPDGRMER